jgi:glutaredoxin
MPNTENISVLIYTTPSCPDCRALKRWLAEKGVAYVERDLSDPQVMNEAKERTGVRVAPITIIDDDIFYGTFAEQKPRLITALGLESAR